MPQVNAWVAGLEVDFWWPVHRLVVETDGGEFHDGRQRAEHDREKDAALALAGIRTHRFDWEQVVDDPPHVAGVVTALMGG